MKINFILIGEGSSDLRLVDHIQSILIEEGFSEVSGEAPKFDLFKQPVGHSVEAKLNVIVEYFPDADLIFVHRDADNEGIDAREKEITKAASTLNLCGKVLPIIPVKMLESWLLADADAIRKVAGARNEVRLNRLPAINRIESVRDPKRLLLEILCEASQTQGARLKKFKSRFSEMRARLTYDLDAAGPVRQLESYAHFRGKVRAFSENFQNGH